MKFYDLTDLQHSDLAAIYPGVPPTRYAVVDDSEYRMWRAVFQLLQKEFFAHFPVSAPVEHALRTLPIMQWVAKLVRPEKIGASIESADTLLPKAFKVAFQGEGTYRDFGYNQLMISMLDILASSVTLPTISWESWKSDPAVDYLGFLAWHQNPTAGERYLPLFMPCARDPKEIRVIDFDNAAPGEPKAMVEYRGERYDALVASSLYLSDYDCQDMMRKLHERGILITPLDFAPANARSWLKFRHAAWATSYPLEFFYERVRSDPTFDDYMLVRVDAGSTPYRWSDVQGDPLLSLELEMTDFWLWQERCESPIDDLTMYWTPCLKYPWIVDRQSEEWIPVLVTGE